MGMGETLGRFEVLGPIATGGMAEILAARQRGLEGFEKLVVIKRLLPELASEPKVVELFLNEARIAARLSHPNIVQIYDLGKQADSYYIAMEYIQGQNLRLVLKACAERERLLPLQHALELVRQVCEGLYYAHTKTDTQGRPLGIVHSDISPQNIVASFDGVAKVVDFGIARAAVMLERSDPGRVRGKHGYLAPERCRGRPVDARSDLFSLGVVLWELCTCRRLFKRVSPIDTVKAIVGGEVPPPRRYNPAVSQELEAVMLRALAVDPDQRFQTALQMGKAVERQRAQLTDAAGSLELGVFMRRLFADAFERMQRLERAGSRGESVEHAWFREEGEDSPPGDSLPPASAPPAGAAPDAGAETTAPSARPPQPAADRRLLRPLLWGLAGLALLVGLGVVFLPQLRGWLGQPRPAPAASGAVVLAVSSRPAGAEVRLDGRRRCLTPCQLELAAPRREHALRVIKKGFQSYATRLRIQPGERRRVVELQLRRAGRRRN
jgi:serine/threonine-protein kinase